MCRIYFSFGLFLRDLGRGFRPNQEDHPKPVKKQISFFFSAIEAIKIMCHIYFSHRNCPDFSECFVLFVSSATSQPSDHAPASLRAHRQAPGRPSRLLSSYLGVGWFWSETQTPSQPRCVTDVFPPFPTLNGLINAYR